MSRGFEFSLSGQRAGPQAHQDGDGVPLMHGTGQPSAALIIDGSGLLDPQTPSIFRVEGDAALSGVQGAKNLLFDSVQLPLVNTPNVNRYNQSQAIEILIGTTRVDYVVELDEGYYPTAGSILAALLSKLNTSPTPIGGYLWQGEQLGARYGYAIKLSSFHAWRFKLLPNQKTSIAQLLGFSTSLMGDIPDASLRSIQVGGTPLGYYSRVAYICSPELHRYAAQPDIMRDDRGSASGVLFTVDLLGNYVYDPDKPYPWGSSRVIVHEPMHPKTLSFDAFTSLAGGFSVEILDEFGQPFYFERINPWVAEQLANNEIEIRAPPLFIKGRALQY